MQDSCQVGLLILIVPQCYLKGRGGWKNSALQVHAFPTVKNCSALWSIFWHAALRYIISISRFRHANTTPTLQVLPSSYFSSGGFVIIVSDIFGCFSFLNLCVTYHLFIFKGWYCNWDYSWNPGSGKISQKRKYCSIT